MKFLINEKIIFGIVVAALAAAFGVLAIKFVTRGDHGQTLVAIGGDRITVEDFNYRISNLPERYRQVVGRRKMEYLEELINDTLLYQEAIRKDVHQIEEVQKVIEEAKRKIIIARFLQDNIDGRIDISDDDVVEYYETNKDVFRTPEILRLSHILVLSRDEAEQILNKLGEGADFDEIARAKSVDPTAQRGGDIGYFPKGQLMPQFEDACSRLEIGEISDVVSTSLGYHIIKLTDRRPPQPVAVERVEDQIRERLYALEKQVMFNELLERLKRETEIVINEEAMASKEENN